MNYRLWLPINQIKTNEGKNNLEDQCLSPVELLTFPSSMARILDMLDILPAIVVQFVQGHCLPIHCQSLPLLDISECWNLEWEKSKRAAHAQVLCLEDLLGFSIFRVIVKSIVIIQKLTVESSNDHDLFWADLAHSRSLSCCDLRLHHTLWNVNSLPVFGG